MTNVIHRNKLQPASVPTQGLSETDYDPLASEDNHLISSSPISIWLGATQQKVGKVLDIGGIAHPVVESGLIFDPSPEKLTPELIFRDYAPRIYNIARRMLGNDADAEDVTQDVLLQVVRKLDAFRGDSQIATWLHRVTVNAALAHHQKRTNRQKHEACDSHKYRLGSGGLVTPGKRWTVEPEETVLAAEQTAIIDKAVEQLPESFRDVYVLADVEGLMNNEIVEMLGLSLAAVKSRLHRARLWMRETLTPQFAGS